MDWVHDMTMSYLLCFSIMSAMETRNVIKTSNSTSFDEVIIQLGEVGSETFDIV